MIFYLCNSQFGKCLAGTQADAKKLDRDFEQVDVPTDKSGLMVYINNLMSRGDDLGGQVTDVSDIVDLPPLSEKIIDEDSREKGLSYTELSIATDEAFDAMPIARQLDLAARAMENARDAL